MEYEGPLLFSCIDEDGSKYLGVSSGFADEHELWVLVKATDERIDAVLTDKLTMFDAFNNAEDGHAIVVQHEIATELETSKRIPCSAIDEKLLPLRGAYLELNHDNALLQEEKNQFYITKCLLKVIVDEDPTKHSLPLSYAGDLLTSFDEFRLSTLFDTDGQYRRITDTLAQSAPAHLVAIRAGSIEIEIQARDPEMPNGKTEASFRRVHEILNLQRDENTIKEYFSQKSISTLIRYNSFLAKLEKHTSSVQIETRYASLSEVDNSLLDPISVARTKQILDEIGSDKTEQLELYGTLFGLDFARNIFSFIPDGEDFPISGKIKTETANLYRNDENSYEVKSFGTIIVDKKTSWLTDATEPRVSYVMISYQHDDVHSK